MLITCYRTLFAIVLLTLIAPSSLLGAGVVEVWGDRVIPDPAVLQDLVKVVSNGDHNLGQRADGSLVAWGANGDGQCDIPAGLGSCISVASGFHRNMAVAADGTIVGWGLNVFGEGGPPPDNTDFQAVAAGNYYSLGLKNDGTIVAWGLSYFGGDVVPEPNEDWIAIAAFDEQSVGLKDDGTVHLWGDVNVSSSTSDPYFVQIAAGYAQALALTDNGSIVHFGIDYHGSASIPAPNSGFVDIAVGDGQALGLKDDTSIVGWGWDHVGQATPGLPNSGYAAVACGYFHSLGLRSDGTVETWGSNTAGQCGIRPPIDDPIAVSTRNYTGLALDSDGTIATWGPIGPAPGSTEPYIAIAAAWDGAAALKVDGTIVTWGDWSGNTPPTFDPVDVFFDLSVGRGHVLGRRADGSIDVRGTGAVDLSNVPPPNLGFIAASVGADFCVALRPDGTIEAWGVDSAGQLNPPAPDPDFMDILAGDGFGIALRNDGTAVSWGDHFTIPEEDNHDLIAIDGFTGSAVAGMRNDGSVVVWSANPRNANIPAPNDDFTAVSASHVDVAVVRGGTPTGVGAPVPALRVPTLELAAGPNPFNPRVTITVRSQFAAETTVEVFDLRGRRIRMLWRGDLTGGRDQEMVWDGRDDDGRVLASGVYLVQARAQNGVLAASKVALVR